ncbi:hypothetical protein AAG906_000410 [Vitis piasezkii]
MSMDVWGVVGLQEKVLRGEEAMQLLFAVDKEGVIFGISGIFSIYVFQLVKKKMDEEYELTMEDIDSGLVFMYIL